MLTALTAATEGELDEAKEYLLSNLSKRMADNLREEIAEADTPTPGDGERAMAEVIVAIQSLVENGDIKLTLQDVDQSP